MSVLDALGVYTFDPEDLSTCDNSDLQSYYLRRQLPSEFIRSIEMKISKMTGDELFEYLLTVAELTSDDFQSEFIHSETLKTSHSNNPNLQDNFVTHLAWLASKMGNSEAQNEVGASQVYCYQNTKQDVKAAIQVLKKASQKGDMLSKLTLGKIYYTGLGGFSDIELGKALQDEAFELAVKELRSARQNIEKFAEEQEQTP